MHCNTGIKLFSSLLLDEPLLDAIDKLGFKEMTEVQAAAIPRALEGKDLIVNARTGSGKTLAYVVPLLQQILDNPQSLTQAIILAPTRDLCRQINKQCTLLAQYTDITTAVIIGGEDPKHQIKALEKYPDIIIYIQLCFRCYIYSVQIICASCYRHCLFSVYLQFTVFQIQFIVIIVL